MPDLDNIRAERRRLKKEFKKLYSAVLAILFRHDPIEINFETNTDEYDPEVRTILPRLKEAHTVDDLRLIIHEEFVRWFDETTAGPESGYDLIAQEIWQAWKRPSG